MSVSQAVSSHIPYLRRFARALSGSQASGDAYVLETLESIIKNPAPFQTQSDMRTALYRAFLTIWGANPAPAHKSDEAGPSDEAGARRNLDAIALRPRIAFLLSSLEGFDTIDVAKTLACSTDEAAALIQTASQAISDHIRTDVLIIEDEPFIALDLQTLVEDLGHHVIGIARTHKEAVKAIEAQKPGLILADIQLADGSSGLEAVNQILGNMEVPVIFITAYPERFLTGQPPEPAFLITKPFGVDALKAVISQALFFDRRSRRADQDKIRWAQTEAGQTKRQYLTLRQILILRESPSISLDFSQLRTNQPPKTAQMTLFRPISDTNLGKVAKIVNEAGTKVLPLRSPYVTLTATDARHAMEEKKKSLRGFAAMSPERQREIARKGGESVPNEKRSFSQNPSLAAEAGRKGGQNVNPSKRSFSQNHDLASAAGRKGGHASHGGKKAVSSAAE